MCCFLSQPLLVSSWTQNRMRGQACLVPKSLSWLRLFLRVVPAKCVWELVRRAEASLETSSVDATFQIWRIWWQVWIFTLGLPGIPWVRGFTTRTPRASGVCMSVTATDARPRTGSVQGRLWKGRSAAASLRTGRGVPISLRGAAATHGCVHSVLSSCRRPADAQHTLLSAPAVEAWTAPPKPPVPECAEGCPGS